MLSKHNRPADTAAVRAARAGTLLTVLLSLSATLAADDPFEIPVVPCDLLAGECRDAAIRPVRNGAWAGVGGARSSEGWRPGSDSGSGPRIRSVSSSARGGDPGPFLQTSAAAARVGGRVMPAAMELGPKTVTVKPGTTVLIEISLGHLNRIVTPFAEPVLHTVATATTEVRGGVIYLATNSEEPVSLYVTDGAEDETALALTLAPRYIPPREIRLRVPGYKPAARTATGDTALANDRTPPLTATPRAPALANAGLGYDGVGSSSPYVSGLVEVLRASARGAMLPGWSVENTASVTCRSPLRVRKTRLLVGPTAAVVTAGVRNSGSTRVHFDEASCSTSEGVVAAVAAWPRRELAPKEETEVYLVVQQTGARPDPTGRPRD
jgi:conjugal transfer pilus assembly protein TraK